MERPDGWGGKWSRPCWGRRTWLWWRRSNRVMLGQDAGILAGMSVTGVPIEENLAEALTRSKAQVMVDFTMPETVLDHLRVAVESGVAAVIGTTGVNAEALTGDRQPGCGSPWQGRRRAQFCPWRGADDAFRGDRR